ncbi:PHD finger protein ALFIN-LIKE 3 isoform X3 [Capsicum galapagoense]
MDKFGSEMFLRTVDEAFENYKGRRQGIINALIKDVDEFREKCDQYNVTDGNWEIKLSSDVAQELPYSRIYKLPKQLTDKNAWLAQVAADSDTWLFSVTFYLCSIYSWMALWRERLFDKMNALPTVSELVKDNHKNLEVATENAKKRVKDKSTVSYHSSKNSKSNSEVVR